MSEIILDISPNTHKNSIKYLKQMIDEVAKIDSKKHEIVIKHQLFLKAPPNLPLDRLVFSRAYEHAKARGYKTTASVFDLDSLNFLMQYDVPFIKVSCNSKYHWLVDEIPRKYNVYVSSVRDEMKYFRDDDNMYVMECVPKYPADLEEYEGNEYDYYSDHTIGLGLWYKFEPQIWEKHLVIHKNKADNPDSGEFSCTPEELREVIG